MVAAITYVEFDGTEHMVHVAEGCSVMEGAVNNGIPGIDAECGGACVCATCQVYVDDAWLDRIGSASEMEAEMLEFADHAKANSRLSCQIEVNEALDGLVVRLPESQR